jgi:hypothetical protein
MGFGAARAAVFDASSRQQQRQQFMGMNAYDRHKKMVHDLITYYGGKLPQAGQVGRRGALCTRQLVSVWVGAGGDVCGA